MYYEDRPIERRNMSENVSLIGQRASYGTPEMASYISMFIYYIFVIILNFTLFGIIQYSHYNARTIINL